MVEPCITGEKHVPIEEYRKRKIRILEELGFPLDEVQIGYLNSLKTEIAIDNFAHDVIEGKLPSTEWFR